MIRGAALAAAVVASLSSCDARSPSTFDRYTIDGAAPWCAVSALPPKAGDWPVRCLYLSEHHCTIALSASGRQTGLEICVPDPRRKN